MEMNSRSLCVFQIGNTQDIVRDSGTSGYLTVVEHLTYNIHIECDAEIYTHEMFGRKYYYLDLDTAGLNKFRSLVSKYRGKGVIILYGFKVYIPPLPVYTLGRQDIIRVNLLLSAMVKLNKHSVQISPVRRFFTRDGELHVYYSYCD